MKKLFARPLTGILLVLFAVHALATVRYVDLNSPNATPPFTDWTTAATNIQDAVDAAVAGDLVLVTNGVYKSGSRLTSDGTQNRVAIAKPVTLQSMNGPTTTSIDGGKVLRCVYLTNAAVVSGFTMTNGKAAIGGGVFCASVNERVLNCQIIKNSASSGGGCYQGTLTNCSILSNTSGNAVGNGGGGAYGSVLYKCILSGNSTGYNTANNGGGAYFCTLSFCTINNNAASEFGYGGGVCNCTVNNCVLFGNSMIVDGDGGGAAYSDLKNCVIFGNYPDGIYRGTASNCTITGNTYLGAGYCNAYNCIIYDNGPADYSGYGVLA